MTEHVFLGRIEWPPF